MKFKLIALAAMLAASGVAQAKVADSNDNVSTSGDLFANLVSASNNASFTVDLGLRLDQFLNPTVNAAGVKLVWDLNGNSFSDLSAVSTGLTTQTLNYGSIYDAFATTAVTGAADFKFDVKAMDGVPATLAGAGTNRYLSTSSASSITALNSQVFGMDNWDVILNASNNDLTNSTHGADILTAGANNFDSGDAANVNFQAGGDQWNGATSFTSTGSASSPLNFFFLSNSSSTSANLANVSTLAGTWSFDATTAQLSYTTAPVPEAETYAMMLAGLGLVGFMVSRRNKRV